MATLSVNRTLSLARSHARTGAPGAARALLTDLLARYPGNARARRALAALGPVPAPPPETLTALLALYRQGNAAGTAQGAGALLSEFPDAAALWNLLGMACQAQGDTAAAEQAFRTATARAPDAPDGHINLGVVLRDQGRPADAIACFDAALRLAPRHADALANLGNAHRQAGAPKAALAAYRAALATNPVHPEALWSLCELLEYLNDLDGLDAALDAEGKAGQAGTPTVLHFRALAAFRRGALDDCAALLARLTPGDLTAPRRPSHLWLRAALADRQGDTDTAFAGFQTMNHAAASLAPASVTAGRAFLAAQRARATRLASLPPPPAPPDDQHDDLADSPVFLVGFPRSGTTLLGTLLQGHSQVSVIEEAELFERLLATCPEAADPAALDTLPAARLEDLRALYRAEAVRHAAPGTLAIDKMPLNLLHAPLIARLFPRARFILALRHPMDSILSAVMQNFRLTPAMACLLTPADAAALYATAMELFDLSRQRHGLAVHELRYEDLVVEPAHRLDGALAFLGLDAEPGMLDHTATARKRGLIATPSYAQVARPVYRTATGRWRRYTAQLSPCVEDIRPWADRFGYKL